jgi:hypothetical protein
MFELVIVILLVVLLVYLIKMTGSATEKNKLQVKSMEENETKSRSAIINREKEVEWEVIKKYVPEVQSSLRKILGQLDNLGISRADHKLRELFFVLGKNGLTDDAISILVNEVREELKQETELAENKIAIQSNCVVNQELIAKLKGSNKLGFNPQFQICEICNKSSTGQYIDEHSVCANCKSNYL